MHQNSHAVRAFVDEQIRMVSSRFAKDSHDTSEGRIDAGAHVERFYRESRRVNADHLIGSRSNNAHSRAADAGLIVTRDQDLRTLDPFRTIRILPAREALALIAQPRS